jgi:hypothetical protein
MSALKKNQQLLNLPSKRQSDGFDSPDPKRACLDDNVIILDQGDVNELDRPGLISHIYQLQYHIDKLQKSLASKEKELKPAPIFSAAPVAAKLTPEQITAKVALARRIMVSGIKSQMTVPS